MTRIFFLFTFVFVRNKGRTTAKLCTNKIAFVKEWQEANEIEINSIFVEDHVQRRYNH